MSEPIYDFAADAILAVRLWNEKVISADTALYRIVAAMGAYNVETDTSAVDVLCANCGESIEPDDGGEIWYHPATMEAWCDPEEPHYGLDPMAEPIMGNDPPRT